MSYFLSTLLASAVLMASPAAAQQHDHDKPESDQQAHHQMHAAPMAALTAYRDALTQRDAGAMMALFADASLVVENGKVEGTFAEYMEHHLGPELDAIKTFEFFDTQTEIEMLGKHAALGRETYRYRIELTDGRVFDRKGVATSVLTHEPGGNWKIQRYHSSSRAL
ncbi:MAG: nuclear transport factor 2 family protein [Pseudomonadota bacterium]